MSKNSVQEEIMALKSCIEAEHAVIKRDLILISKRQDRVTELEVKLEALKKKSQPLDITGECHVEWKESQMNPGNFYGSVIWSRIGKIDSRGIMHANSQIQVACLGWSGATSQPGFHLEQGDGAKTSFKIFKEPEC